MLFVDWCSLVGPFIFPTLPQVWGWGSGVTGSRGRGSFAGESFLQWALCASALYGRVELLGEGGSVGALEGDLPASALGGGAAEAAVAGGGALHTGHLAGGGAHATPLLPLQLLPHQLALATHLWGRRGTQRPASRR